MLSAARDMNGHLAVGLTELLGEVLASAIKQIRLPLLFGFNLQTNESENFLISNSL